jgi:hypothetical protein
VTAVISLALIVGTAVIVIRVKRKGAIKVDFLVCTSSYCNTDEDVVEENTV